MPESVLSFTSSSSFRDLLISRNLPPYQVEGSFNPPSGDVVYEISPLNDSNVIDSPNNLISTNQLANNFEMTYYYYFCVSSINQHKFQQSLLLL